MSTSWRIKTNLVDKTEITSTDSLIVGATVIKSPKGPNKFTFFRKGDKKGILDTFGYPSKEYPSIQDALDVIGKSALWVASPYSKGKFGGVYITPTGTIPFVNGVEDKTLTELASVPCNIAIGKGNSVITEFTATVKNHERVDNTSFVLTVGEQTSNLTIGEMGAITDSSNLLTSGTYDEESGEMTLTFNIAPEKVDLSLAYTMDVSDTYFILFNKDMQKDDLQVQVKKSEDNEGAFEISVLRFNPIIDDYEELGTSPYVVGLKPTSKDTYGSNIFIENIFGEDNQTLFTPLIVNNTITEFVDDTTPVALNGGDRGIAPEGSDVAGIYSELEDTNKFIIKFAFDPTASKEVTPIFESLRNDYQKYCRFLYCTTNSDANSIIADGVTFANGVTANRGLYCYCLNWGIHVDSYQGNDFLCSNMGLIASRLVDVLTVGGGVPAWIDENGVGGILGSSITKLIHGANETQLEQLDNLGFNPVVMDTSYGAMIVGWRTRQIKKTVYSYIGQSSLADTILDLITKNVLPQRIGKLIDETSYSAVRTGCNTILNAYSQWLEDYYVLCDGTNNSDESRNNQILNVSVGVVFKGYAQKIVFNFVTYKNGIKVEEELKKN